MWRLFDSIAGGIWKFGNGKLMGFAMAGLSVVQTNPAACLIINF